MIPRRVPVSLAVALLAAGCKGDRPTDTREVFQLALQGGDEQSGPAGSVLSEPLQVVVKGPTGSPIRGVTVAFEPAAGVQLSDTRMTSAIDGVARVDVRVGATEGEYEIARAFIPGSPADTVRFTATVTPPPTLSSVSPNTVRAGDTVTLVGANFNQSLVGNAVYFGDARALVVDGVGTTQLRAVVPPCLPAGQVAVRVQIGSAATNTVPVSNEAFQSTIALAPLQGITVSGAELGACLRLPGDSARYLVVPQFATASLELQPYQYRLGNASGAAASFAVAAGAAAGESHPQVRLDYALRSIEHTLTAQVRAYAASRPPGVSLQALSLNSTRSFRVLSELPRRPTDPVRFSTANALLKYIGQNVLLYVDQAAPGGTVGFTQAELDAMGRQFDTELYELGVRSFGTESDVDNNDRVIVLLTPIVNGLTEQPCTGGFVTGFFFGYDLGGGRDSNRGEVFYSLVPDASGQFSCPHSKAQVQRIVPGTFIHEFQHMISYNQHVVVRGGVDETLWLNEGMSHIAEELAARYYEPIYPAPPGRLFSDTVQNFIIGNLFNSYEWLLDPTQWSVASAEGYGELTERGAAWLFLRWLIDLKGDAIIARLVQTRKTSVENVEDKTGESFASLFGDFSIALWADSIPNVARESVPERYRFKSWNLRRIYKALYDATQRTTDPLPLPFPIVPKDLPPNTTQLGSMVPGTMDFWILQTSKPSSDVGLQFGKPTSECPGGGACLFGDDFKAQVSVFRLPIP